MSRLRKHTVTNMAGWSQKDKEAFAKGARGESVMTPAPTVDAVPAQAGETPEEADVGNQQAANLADPSRAAALEKMVIARRKFLGK